MTHVNLVKELKATKLYRRARRGGIAILSNLFNYVSIYIHLCMYTNTYIYICIYRAVQFSNRKVLGILVRKDLDLEAVSI